MSTDILNKLEGILRGKVIILGIGNPIRGDDAIGSVLAERLVGKISVRVYNGGSSPENLLGKIVQENPDTVLIVDAVDFGGAFGDLDIFNSENIKTANLFSTHNLSPRLIFDFLKEYTQAKTYLLAIQPKSIDLGDKMSLEIEDRLNLLTDWFIEQYPVLK
ncbi:MAG: hydrogenase 3 maturation endopeptidase HyCI [Candidatus Omnitrophica bacterium]|nr:hydrogenase 3 maturation endopeptidase HyCI [Candidatus Omnitrophota bacterium]